MLIEVTGDRFGLQGKDVDCPKCNAAMKERTVDTLHGKVTIDECTGCKGLWFDKGEEEALKGDWMSEFVDRGDPEVGKSYNAVKEVKCPRCGEPMEAKNDPKQTHLEFEACAEHGMFMDAGEFTDFKHDTLMDRFRDLIAHVRRRSA